jgi:hypothetical protein
MNIADEAERYLKIVVGEHPDPAPRECLVCYVARMLDLEDCDDTLQWTLRFRDRRSPSATGLEHRLAAKGVQCDCAVLSDYRLARHLLVRDLASDELEPPAEAPLCDGVGHSSTHPCVNWERRSA